MYRRTMLVATTALALSGCELFSSSSSTPPPAPAASAPPAAEATPHVVFFTLGKAVVDAKGLATVREAAAAAKKPGVKSVEVVGHTDRAGADKANDALSTRRANAVRQALIKEGVPAAMITARGVGEGKPFMATEDGKRAPENRRVEITVR